jgi:hypothetical protein
MRETWQMFEDEMCAERIACPPRVCEQGHNIHHICALDKGFQLLLQHGMDMQRETRCASHLRQYMFEQCMTAKTDLEVGEEIEAGHKHVHDNWWVRATDVDVDQFLQAALPQINR